MSIRISRKDSTATRKMLSCANRNPDQHTFFPKEHLVDIAKTKERLRGPMIPVITSARPAHSSTVAAVIRRVSSVVMG